MQLACTLGAAFIVSGLALAYLGGRAISTQVKPSIDSRIWIGSTMAVIGSIVLLTSALLWLLVG
jgi:ribose/xylose/arabinose/galactoside ABC-type transport system permease subunit